MDALTAFAQGVVSDAKKELAAKQPKKSYRATWKGGQLQSYRVSIKRYASDTNGQLSDSIRYEINEVMGNTIVTFYALDYWYYVNFGRKPGKGVPVDIMRQWVYDKGIKPQKGGGRGFAKITANTFQTMAFLMNRKIRTFGYEGNNFFTKTVDIYTEELRENLGKRVAKDLAQTISKWPLT